MGTMTSPRELFVHELRDVYFAERQIERKLPTMIDEARDEELATGLEKHLQETRQQIANLDEIFSSIGEKPKSERCPGIEGIAEEHDLFMRQQKPSAEVCDMFLTGAAARVEHYEIAAYNGLITMARGLGEMNAAGLLEKNLDQEKQALRTVEGVAERMASELQPATAR